MLQDRLIKELRLAGISDRAGGNQFLRKYLAGLNRRFARVAASAMDAHRAVPRHLEEILSWQEERVVQADWTVACGGKWYQLDRQHEAMSLVKRKVIVRTLRDGREQILYGGQKLKWRSLPGRPQRIKTRRALKAKVFRPPGPEHPWRRLGMAVGREFRGGVKARGRMARLGLRDSGRPPLRSGLPASRSPNEEQTKRQKGTFSPE